MCEGGKIFVSLYIFQLRIMIKVWKFLLLRITKKNKNKEEEKKGGRIREKSRGG